MKRSRVVCASIAVCAFVCISLVHEAPATATSSIPATVVITPSSTTVVSGKSVGFTAVVKDQNGKKMSGVKLTWSLTSTPGPAGTAISQQGKFTTTAGTTPLGTYTDLVQAAVASNPSVYGQASLSVTAMPFAGGVFIGTRQCTENCSDGEDQSPLAVDATATTFKALTIDSSDFDAQQFTGTISNGTVSATFRGSGGHQIVVSGTISFGATGEATGITATYTKIAEDGEQGSVTLSAVPAASGAGPKIGSWSIPKNKPSSGNVYAIFDANGTLVGSASTNKNGTLEYNPFSGTWAAPGAVDFTTASSSVTGGSGTCNSGAKSCSGKLYDNSTAIGTWRVGAL